MRFLFLMVLLTSCGDDSQIERRSEWDDKVYRPYPGEPGYPDQNYPGGGYPDRTQPSQSRYDYYTDLVKRSYRMVRIEEGGGISAITRGNQIIMGQGLKQRLSAEGYLAILLHEVSHYTERNGRPAASEPLADYHSMEKLRRILRIARRPSGNSDLMRVAQENYRFLATMPDSRYHPPANCRLQIYQAGIYKKSMPYCARPYLNRYYNYGFSHTEAI